LSHKRDRLCDVVVRVPGYRSRVPGSIPGATRFSEKARRRRWAGHIGRMGEKGNAYRLLVGKPEGRRPLGRPRRRWLDNIRMYLVEVGRGDMDWIGLAQDMDRWRAHVNLVLNLRVP
jgi:hypothetical protein